MLTKTAHGINYNNMGVLRKTLGENLDATVQHQFDIPRTFNFNNFTVEAKFNGEDTLSYPASENDAELLLQDDEGGNSQYVTINGGLVKAAEESDQAKIRIVDLATQNVRVIWKPNSADGGTIDTLTITFKK
jgi:hypothetical protein